MTILNMVQTRLLRRLSVLLLAGLVGCASQKATQNCPTQSLPPFSPSGQTYVPNRWWTAFGDPRLDFFVNQALGENFTLAVALDRLRAARALTRREASDLFPDINGVILRDDVFGPGHDQGGTVWGLDAAYQVDLWGQIQSRVDAERFRAEATLAEYHAVALSLAAEVARTWYALIEAHAQLELLNEQIQTNRDGLIAQKLRFSSGLVRLPDVDRQAQLVESTMEQAVVVRAQIEVLEHQMAVLTGQMPQTVSYDPGTVLPELPPLPDAGLPSELLMRRPDVRADYFALEAADRDLAAAISDQYPRLNLTGSVLNAAERGDAIFRNWFVSIGAQLIAPLVDGGQRRAEVDRTSAVVGQAFNELGQSLLVAFREVEDSLALEHYQIQRIERINAQERLAQRSSDQLLQQYFIGDAAFLDILSATQSKQSLQRDMLSARLDLILIRISLYLALAGDFDPRPQAVEYVELSEDRPSSPPAQSGAPLDTLDSLPGTLERLPPTSPDPELPLPAPKFEVDE